jgi:hypothetical protein
MSAEPEIFLVELWAIGLYLLLAHAEQRPNDLQRSPDPQHAHDCELEGGDDVHRLRSSWLAGDREKQSCHSRAASRPTCAAYVHDLEDRGRAHLATSRSQRASEELKDFQRKVSDAGRATYNARVGAHDDLVLAVAIALWFATNMPTCKVEELVFDSPLAAG